MPAKPSSSRVTYAGIEFLFGVVCPLLWMVSMLHAHGLLQWSALLFLWLGYGHSLFYFYQIYPTVKYRPFLQGLAVVGLGLMWPLWCAQYAAPKR
jgi:hypothetical protein